MSANAKKAPANISLDYFCFEFPDEPVKQLEAAVEELQSSVIRLFSILWELQRTAETEVTEETIGHVMKYLQYHGETFLTAVYEFRERLILLLAVLTNYKKEDLTGRGGYQRRQGAIAGLRRTRAGVATDIQDLENTICDSVKLRGTMTHEAFVHLSLVVDGYPFDPEDALVQYKGDADTYGKLQDVISREIDRFITARETDCGSIDRNVVSIAKALGFPAVSQVLAN